VDVVDDRHLCRHARGGDGHLVRKTKMILFLFILSFIINFIAITVAIPTIINTYQRYSRGKLVVCPQKNQQATIALSPKIAAVTAIFVPKEIRVVKACSLWPEIEHCNRACAAQVR
jgi:hypothetical protein